MREVVARAPARIDFGGGWTDVPPYPEERGGCVCNVAVTRRASVRLVPLAGALRVSDGVDILRGAHAEDVAPTQGTALAVGALRRFGVTDVSLELQSDFPRGAGLGGSSAVGVALAAALATWRREVPFPTPTELAERSHAVETMDLRVPGGSQDHYAAALGGALEIQFGRSVCPSRIQLSPNVVSELESRCIVVYTGESRISGETITAVLDAYRSRDRGVIEALGRMAALAAEMARTLRQGALDDLAGLVGEHWSHQRQLHPRISTPAIERVLKVARDAGALGGKALGASGGGCVLVIARRDRVEEVRQAVEREAALLPFALDLEGVQVTGS